MTHLMLEIYCDWEKNKLCDIPNFCKNKPNNPTSNCFEYMCKHLSYTDCKNEIAYIGEKGIVETPEESIGFGVDMEPRINEEYEINKKKLIKLWGEI